MSFVSLTRCIGCLFLLLASLGFSITYAPGIRQQAEVISLLLGVFGLIGLSVSFGTGLLPEHHWVHERSDFGAAVVAACVTAVILACAVS